MENTLQSAAPRNDYLDFVKGIAIFLVEFGHCIQYGSGNEFVYSASFFNDWMFRLIYSFHMPLFMLVSGYVFFWTVSKRTLLGVVKRQALSLLLPAACWTVTYRVYLQILAAATGGTFFSPEWIKGLPSEIWGSHWFFWAVFWCSVITVAVRRWAGDRLWVHAVIGVCLLFLPNDLVTNYPLYAFMYPYFIAGYFANKYRFAAMSVKRYRVVFPILLVLFAALFPGFSYDTYIYTTHISLLHAEEPLRQLSIDLFRWSIGFVGGALVLLSIYAVWKFWPNQLSWLRRCFLYMGRRTLGLYVISSYLNFEILFRVSRNFSLHYSVTLLEAVAMLALSAGIVAILERFRWSRFLYLGRR